MTAMRRKTPALTAFALGEPILPIGFLPNGRPIFPIAGGSEDPPAEDPPGKGGDGFTPITSQDDLNRIVGERLSRERAKYEGFDDYKAKAEKYDEAIEAAKTEQERAVEAAKAEGRTEALTTANARLVAAEARALAAEAKFRNPAAATRLLDLADVKVNDNGEPDRDAIKSRLDDLAKSDPYLVDDGKKAPPKPDRSQGGSGSGAGDSSVARGREMYAERRGGATKTA